MGRPRKYTVPYTGDGIRMEFAFQEYLASIVDCFGGVYDDRDKEGAGNPKCGKLSLRNVCDEFHISMSKARKLLITANAYSTELSRQITALSLQGKSVSEMMGLTGLSRSSVNSYLPYKKFSYNMEEISRHAEDTRKYRDRKKAVDELHEKIITGKRCGHLEKNDEDVFWQEMREILWQAVIAYQNYSFHTSSGLPFSYTVKRKKNGEYSGELLVSRKEESKTLTRSSVMLAFHTVFEEIKIVDIADHNGNLKAALAVPEYKGPKAIGQIFGISYIYSLFWKMELIKIPDVKESQ